MGRRRRAFDSWLFRCSLLDAIFADIRQSCANRAGDHLGPVALAHADDPDGIWRTSASFGGFSDPPAHLGQAFVNRHGWGRLRQCAIRARRMAADQRRAGCPVARQTGDPDLNPGLRWFQWADGDPLWARPESPRGGWEARSPGPHVSWTDRIPWR